MEDFEKVDDKSLQSSSKVENEEKQKPKILNEVDNIMHAPFVLAFDVRTEIMAQRKNNELNKQLFHRHACIEEFKIMDHISTFECGEKSVDFSCYF